MANLQASTHKLQKNLFPLIKAKFPSKCSMTELPVSVGEKVFYNPESRTVQKAIKVYANVEGFGNTNHPLFQTVEAIFNVWIKDQPSDTYDQYFGAFEEMNGGSYVSKKGAIKQAIENMVEEMEEEEIGWAWMNNMDVVVGFQI